VSLFKKAVKNLSVFMEKCDHENVHDCVNHGMLLLRKTESQLIDDGFECPVNISTCEWAINQAIINRNECSMMQAVMQYVENTEERIWTELGFNI